MAERLADLDPFEAAAMRQRMAVRPPGGRREGLATATLESYVPNVLGGLATLPQRAFDSATSAALGGSYDPAPIMETMGLMTGGSAPQGALRAMSLRRRGMPPAEQIPSKAGGQVGTYTAVSDKPGVAEFPLRLEYNPKTKDIYIDWIGADFGDKNMWGPKEIRSLLQALKKEYPEAKTITGERVSGARYVAGKDDPIARMRMPGVPKEEGIPWYTRPGERWRTGSQLTPEEQFAVYMLRRETE